MLIAGSLQFLLGAIDQIQLIVHLPILDVKFPANTMKFYNYIVPIVNFDILSEIKEYNLFLFDISTSRTLEFGEEEDLTIAD